MTRKHCILFLINSLAAGGAERQLSELVKAMDRDRFDLHVAVFYDPGYRNQGELWSEVASIPGVTLHSLHKRQGVLGYLTAVPRLINLIWRIEPDILHGYLQGNLTVLLVGSLLRIPIAWGIRRTSSNFSGLDRMSLALLRVEVWLAHFVDLVIFNSEAGSRNYQAMGMRTHAMQVIPNGFEVTRFAPDPTGGLAQRKAWGIPKEAPLIGIIGRLAPVKDHPTFLRMASRLIQAWPTAWFVCVGDGNPAYLESLQAMARSLGIADRVLWPGVCLDMPSAYNALSLLVLSSSDEGFPNVLGEAMACGIPCIATPAGDAPVLLGDTGHLCAFGDDEALASAASSLLGEPPGARAVRAAACRAWITTQFSTQALAQSTEKAMLGLLHRNSPPQEPAGAPLMSTLFDGPHYLLRFDDICPTMDWSTWNAVEELLIAQGVKPILAVIPDNRDPTLMIDPPAPDFWDRVRGWQARGWAIGLHGYQHLRVNSEPGILGFPSKSEFAGLPYEEQLHKLNLGLEIFARERVRPDVWIAPSHSFDLVTVAALRDLGIRTISDGLAIGPYQDHQGTVWIPQQYSMMRPMPWGVWTFCYHSGDFAGAGMGMFQRRLAQLAPRMISLVEARALGGRGFSPLDRIVGLSRWLLTITQRQRTRWAS
jgi:glycosyltransferase involved in cell wall biosynthesis/predicted deacetylase